MRYNFKVWQNEHFVLSKAQVHGNSFSKINRNKIEKFENLSQKLVTQANG